MSLMYILYEIGCLENTVIVILMAQLSHMMRGLLLGRTCMQQKLHINDTVSYLLIPVISSGTEQVAICNMQIVCNPFASYYITLYHSGVPGIHN